MLVFPNAKINLGLNILRKRPDGFHDIETIFYPCFGYQDIVELVLSKETEIKIFGDVTVDGDPMDNLCMKAYRLLREDFDIPPVKINLFKHIPVGAGLGGGSADAAFTLKGLNSLFSLGIDDKSLANYASRLGSDCAFFIYNRPMIACGRGEELTPSSISLEGYITKIYPQPVFVSTREAYSGVSPKMPDLHLSDISKYPIDEWKDLMFNDFETSVFARYPELAEVKQSLYDQGAVYASMTGSGSSIFGIFRNKQN